MRFEARDLCGIFLLLASVCYICETTANNGRDIRSTPDTSKTGTNNKSRNDTATQPIVSFKISEVPQQSEFLRIIINAKENNTVVRVRTPYIKYTKSFVETNQVLEFTRKMLSKFNDSLTNRTETSASSATSHIKNDQLNQYKTATVALAVLCAIMLTALLFLTIRSRAKSTSKPSDTPQVVAKQPAESDYQSIRGLPRRQTGNSYGYETVKPRLPPTRPSITYLLQPNEGEYENLKLNDIATNVRESNPYVPMNEALAGSGLTGSQEVLSGEDEDLYLTMKRLIRPEDTAVQINDLGSI